MALRSQAITADPAAIEQGSLGFGMLTFVDSDGNVQTIPNTHTPPFGEPPAHEATVEVDPNYGPALPVTATDQMLHDAIHGTPWHGYDIEEWVNPENPGIANLGPINVQAGQSGHSQNVVHNASAEQGWGLDPAVLYPRYPKATNTNPYYSSGIFRRNGGLAWQSDGVSYDLVTQQRGQLWQGTRKHTSATHGRLVDLAPSVPFSSTVNSDPYYSGEVIPAEAEGYYP